MQTTSKWRQWQSTLVATGLLLALAGCGGGGGGGSTPAASAETSVAGTVLKGPVAGATVTGYAIESGAMGRAIGSGTTDAQGNFSMSLGMYTGPVMVRAAGGHFTNEATGADMPMQQGDVMTAMIDMVSPGSSQAAIQVTPLTSIAQAMAQRMSGGMTAANIASANASVGAYFMVSDIVHVHPMNPLTPGSGSSADTSMRNYGMTLGAMSQLASSLGMPFASGMVTAMMDDASDGCFDGMMSGAPVMMGGGMMMGGVPGGGPLPSFAGTTGMANAMSDFVRSAQNHSGVTLADMQALINRMMTSNCSLH